MYHPSMACGGQGWEGMSKNEDSNGNTKSRKGIGRKGTSMDGQRKRPGKGRDWGRKKREGEETKVWESKDWTEKDREG